MFKLTIYNLKAEYARVHSVTTLDIPKEDAIRTLEAVRDGLPKDFGASLTDEYGHNVH